MRTSFRVRAPQLKISGLRPARQSQGGWCVTLLGNHEVMYADGAAHQRGRSAVLHGQQRTRSRVATSACGTAAPLEALRYADALPTQALLAGRHDEQTRIARVAVIGPTLLILFTQSLDVGFAVRIEEFLTALLPRRFEFRRCDVPVRPAFLANGT
jgi:hypothetical protein